MDTLGYGNGTGQDRHGYEFAKGFGRMFYVINPKEHVYEDIDEVPNFYVQVYFFIVTQS